MDSESDAQSEVLDVIIDGVVVDEILAGLYREDLAAVGIRGGYARFLYRIPDRFLDGKPHVLELRHKRTNRPIDNTPTSFTFEADGSESISARHGWAFTNLVISNGADTDAFRSAARAAGRVAFISTFGNAHAFLAYHGTILRELSQAGFASVVIHAAGSDATVQAPEVPGTCLIVKRNVGYDFGSWAIGVFALDAILDELDEVLLLNDSVVPADPDTLGQLIRRARDTGADVVGVTESYERTYHLQSYFILLAKKVCRSQFLQRFMASYSFTSDKQQVIAEGELSLTAKLDAAGFRIACLNPYERVVQQWLGGIDRVVEEIRSLPITPHLGNPVAYKTSLIGRLDEVVSLVVNGTPMNPAHFFWDTLLESGGSGLLKRELAIQNPCRVPTHFRLGRLLADRPDAGRAILEIRRRYGGDLVPLFWYRQPEAPRHGAAPADGWTSRALNARPLSGAGGRGNAFLNSVETALRHMVPPSSGQATTHDGDPT